MDFITSVLYFIQWGIFSIFKHYQGHCRAQVLICFLIILWQELNYYNLFQYFAQHLVKYLNKSQY